MSLKRILMMIPVGMLLLGSIPTLAQTEPGIDSDIPSDVPTDTIPETPEPSAEPDITPDVEVDTSAPNNIGGTSTDGPYSLVQCGPNGAAVVVTKIPTGCHILDINSPPGQSGNAESS